MRMATFNILHGRSVHDGAVDLDRLVDAIRRTRCRRARASGGRPDQPRSGMADLTAVAAEAMGAVSHRFVAAIAGTPGATWMAATGREQPGTAAYGIALLSRFPPTTGRWCVCPGSRRGSRCTYRGRAACRWSTRSHGPAMVARLDTPLGPLTVANTHLSFVPGVESAAAAATGPGSTRLSRPAGPDGRPEHDATGDRAGGAACGRSARRRRSRPTSPTSAGPHPDRRRGLRVEGCCGARAADLGSSRARHRHFAAMTP